MGNLRTQCHTIPQTNKALIRSPIFESLQKTPGRLVPIRLVYQLRQGLHPAVYRGISVELETNKVTWNLERWMVEERTHHRVEFLTYSWCLVIFETGRRPARWWVVGGLSTNQWHKADGTWWYVLDSLRIPKGCHSRYQNYVFWRPQECHCEGLVFPYDGSGFLGRFAEASSFFLAILRVTFSGWWPENPET